LIAFIKSGDLSMVYGLLENFRLGRSLTLLRGCTEEFEFGKYGGETSKVSMSTWNPLLLAIGF